MKDTEHTLLSGSVGLALVVDDAAHWGAKFLFAVAVALTVRLATTIGEGLYRYFVRGGKRLH